MDRFCVLGSVEDHHRKLRELADAGVDQFNVYLMNGDEEEQPSTSMAGKSFPAFEAPGADDRAGGARRVRSAHRDHPGRRLRCSEEPVGRRVARLG